VYLRHLATTQQHLTAATALSAHLRRALYSTRMRHLSQSLPAFFKRRPFVRAGGVLVDTRPDLRAVMAKMSSKWWLVAHYKGVPLDIVREGRQASVSVED